MTNLFKKAAVCCDLHIGLKSNSSIHLKDCEDFIDWFIDAAKANGCETGLFLGDWIHTRNHINLNTLKTSITCLEKLGSAFDQFFFLLGNHDNFYKDRRDVHSSMFGKFIPGITVVDELISTSNVTLCPWLIGDEWKLVGKKPAEYIFGHFEVPNFLMNSVVAMPDHGLIQLDTFKNYQLGFSGHFHKRQKKNNMQYIGNCFPHNFSDVNDTERGMMILEWGQEPVFHAWPNQPTFSIMKLSELIDQADSVIKPKQYLKIKLDIDISFEEANFIKEQFMNNYDIRELSLIPEKENLDINSTVEIQGFESIEKIVSDQLLSIDSVQYDCTKLLDIYRHL